MIAALVNAGVMLQQPHWLDLAKRAFAFIAQRVTPATGSAIHGGRGNCLLPGLASDYAAMIRAALALHEAGRGCRMSLPRWPGRPTSIVTTPTGTTAATTSPPTMPKAWWVAAPELDHRRSQCRTPPGWPPRFGAARRPHRRRHLAGARRSCSTACCRSRLRACTCTPACSTASICACARHRDRRARPASRKVRRRGAGAALPRSRGRVAPSREHRKLCRRGRRHTQSPSRRSNRRPRMRRRTLLPTGRRRAADLAEAVAGRTNSTRADVEQTDILVPLRLAGKGTRTDCSPSGDDGNRLAA